ncbi:MAG: superoxide dismutase [Pseudomonadales bacterium]
MYFDLPELPYPDDALEPHMSQRTLFHHHKKHHQGYLDKLKKAVEGTPTADLPLEQIVRSTTGPTFNSAAQVWNHNFFWPSLSPDRTQPDGDLKKLIDQSFGSLDKWKSEFSSVAAAEFGSGWTWLAYHPAEERLSIFSTTDAITPVLMNVEPLLTLDVWEHAYYLDYQQDRAAYIEAFVEHLANWETAAERLQRALS